MSPRARTSITLSVTVAAILALPSASSAQLKVIVSGGFAAAYREVLPEFEKTAGIAVTTGSGASQGSGPEVIAAQLARGVPADVVILSKEGLQDLVRDGRIQAGTETDLAQTLIGLAVRAGAPRPDISTVAALTQSLLQAKTVAVPGSTTGLFLTREIFPRLGVANAITVTMTARGADSVGLVAAGGAAVAMQPVSEILHMPGVDFVGTIPADVQYLSVFSAAVVAGSSKANAAKQLIAFLASDQAAAAIKKSGMERSRR